MHEHVLVVLDGTPRAEKALPAALHCAQERDDELRLVRLVGPRLSLPGRKPKSEVERSAWLYLVTIAEQLKHEHPRTTYEVHSGPALALVYRWIRAGRTVFLAGRCGALFHHSVGSRLVRRMLGLHSSAPAVHLVAETRPHQSGWVRSFNEDTAGACMHLRRIPGIRAVELSRIVGSVGRSRELDSGFRPRSAGERSLRYRELCKAMERMVEIPPIELYKLHDCYYILDGHHRVSIALALGWSHLDAEIAEAVPMHDAEAKALSAERLAFERRYRLESIEVVRSGGYPMLASLIDEHASAHAIAGGEDAAQAWYARTYLPLARRLQAANLEALFPRKRTGDIVVHLADFKREQEAFRGHPMSWDEAFDAFLYRHSRPSR